MGSVNPAGAEVALSRQHQEFAGDLGFAIGRLLDHYERRGVPREHGLALIAQVTGTVAADLVRTGQLTKTGAVEVIAENAVRGLSDALQEPVV
ncbi:hypothetical protein [Ferrovibrio sp.]|uniref:hypothetical protein n=1 Tax=Ferrovibrio sp. TaxID=1917215 RepID=UPI0035B3CB2B